MRFFTRPWATGELSDDEFEAVPDAYRRHLLSLDLPPTLVPLAEADLHDGRVLDVDHRPERGWLSVRLRCGDLQRGYHDLRLVYSGAAVDSDALAVLSTARGSDHVEVLYDEIDRASDGYEHRVLFWPSGEVAVRFESVEVLSSPVASRSAV